MPPPRKCDQETQARAGRMYADRLPEAVISQLKARQQVGELLGINPATLQNWFRRAQGKGTTPVAGKPRDEEHARLRREVAQLKRTNEIR
ncbi:hypothetical protein AS188_15280 [Kocuria flava]|uniref:Transposase n=1 Tax=Kocuria flava TaxID=446860 RepID=A0A0U3HZK0_9MICC|nr:hypothetical protein AS188_15280 [Kocuria flava]GEO91555.1 transposase [Kocuria flava]